MGRVFSIFCRISFLAASAPSAELPRMVMRRLPMASEPSRMLMWVPVRICRSFTAEPCRPMTGPMRSSGTSHSVTYSAPFQCPAIGGPRGAPAAGCPSVGRSPRASASSSPWISARAVSQASCEGPVTTTRRWPGMAGSSSLGICTCVPVRRWMSFTLEPPRPMTMPTEPSGTWIWAAKEPAGRGSPATAPPLAAESAAKSCVMAALACATDSGMPVKTQMRTGAPGGTSVSRCSWMRHWVLASSCEMRSPPRPMMRPTCPACTSSCSCVPPAGTSARPGMMGAPDAPGVPPPRGVLFVPEPA